MKKNNTYVKVLRSGLLLSMLFGVGFQAEQVLAEEQLEDPNQINTSSEIIPEVTDISASDILENDAVQELEKEIESTPVEITGEFEIHTEDKLEESMDAENLDDDELEIAGENETGNLLKDETLTIDEYKLSQEETDEKVAVVEEEPVKEEVMIEDNDSIDLSLTPALMTRVAKTDASNQIVNVDRVHGLDRFENAVEISKKGWSTAPKVFIANGNKFADSLTGSPLAALYDAPILLTRDNKLPEATLVELKRLNTKEIVILGGELSVSKQVVDTLKQNGFIVTRIGGNNRYTQAELVANEIMRAEGMKRDAFLTSGEVFSDALSIATVASGKRLPIYLTKKGHLEQSVKNAIPFVNSWTIIGGELSINRVVETAMKNAGAKVKRIQGKDRYEVNRNVLDYYGVPEEHLYVTSGEHYSDTLPASVLASKVNSGVLLLKNNNKKTNDEQKLFAQNKHKIRNFTVVGGPATLSEETKNNFEELIRTVDNDMLETIKRQFLGYAFSQYDITLKEALDMQMFATPQTDKKYTAYVSKDFIDARSNNVTADVLNVHSGVGSDHIIAHLKKGTKVKIVKETGNWYEIDLKQTWLNANQDDVAYYLNPNNFLLSDKQKFQFLDLSRTSNATTTELNRFLKGKGILEGKGQAFIDAGNKHGVNEIYLLSHALLETGHGTSDLATGVQVNGNKVYNMFGIGAYDDDPVVYGSLRAHEENWYTPEEAIIGGAAFIGTNYVKAGQNTLYKMRWNPESMANNGYASHQYATDIGWAYKQVNTMYSLYNSIGISLRHVDIPVYLA